MDNWFVVAMALETDESFRLAWTKLFDYVKSGADFEVKTNIVNYIEDYKKDNNDPEFQKLYSRAELILSLVKNSNTRPSLIASELVNVQPLSGDIVIGILNNRYKNSISET